MKTKQFDDMTLEEKLMHHNSLKTALTALKTEEMRVRVELASFLLQGKGKGSYKFQYPNMDVKVSRGYNYSIDQSRIKEYIDNNELSDEEIKAIRTKYELNLKEYKLINSSDCVSLLDECITVTESAPTLEVSLV